MGPPDNVAKAFYKTSACRLRLRFQRRPFSSSKEQLQLPPPPNDEGPPPSDAAPAPPAKRRKRDKVKHALKRAGQVLAGSIWYPLCIVDWVIANVLYTIALIIVGSVVIVIGPVCVLL